MAADGYQQDCAVVASMVNSLANLVPAPACSAAVEAQCINTECKSTSIKAWQCKAETVLLQHVGNKPDDHVGAMRIRVRAQGIALILAAKTIMKKDPLSSADRLQREWQ